jgi:hypothetical protein
MIAVTTVLLLGALVCALAGATAATRRRDRTVAEPD